MKWLVCASVCVLTFGLAGVAKAAEDPTGTWKWTITRGDQEREVSLTLKLEDGKLTGSMPGRNDQVTEISDGKFENDTVSFTIKRTRGDREFVTKYSGKVSGDTLTGTIESPGRGGGEARSREWTAKRSAE
jgi:hypothetical protein